MVLLYDNLTRSHSIGPVIGRVHRHRPCVAVRVEDNLCGGQGRHGARQGGDVAALLDTGGVAAVYCLCGGYCTRPGYYWIDQGARWSFCHSIVRICYTMIIIELLRSSMREIQPIPNTCRHGEWPQ